ncbi:hypothetical protein DBV15_04521, partial [Temnothorax longispinosus]
HKAICFTNTRLHAALINFNLTILAIRVKIRPVNKVNGSVSMPHCVAIAYKNGRLTENSSDLRGLATIPENSVMVRRLPDSWV